MSVNKVNKTTGELITLANGTRMWIGTKAAHDAAVAAGTMPNNCMVCITDDYPADDGVVYRYPSTGTAKVVIFKQQHLFIMLVQGATLTEISDGLVAIGYSSSFVQYPNVSRRNASNNDVRSATLAITNTTVNGWYANDGVEHELASTDVVYSEFILFKE